LCFALRFGAIRHGWHLPGATATSDVPDPPSDRLKP
jgi:hypothetical protein